MVKKLMTIRVEEKLAEQIEDGAKQEGISVSEFTRRILDKHFSEGDLLSDIKGLVEKQMLLYDKLTKGQKSLQDALVEKLEDIIEIMKRRE